MPEDWLVQIPLSHLVELRNLVEELHQMRSENKQLKQRMDALHRTQYELMEQFLILRKECQPKR